MDLELTVTAGLNGSLDIADALDGDTVLVVPVDVLVLELPDLVKEDTEFVGDVRNVFVTGFAPQRELLLDKRYERLSPPVEDETLTHSHFHPLLCDVLHAPHDILLHLDELRELPGQVGTKGSTGIAAESMACLSN